MEIMIKGRYSPGIPIILVGYDQLCLSPNHITRFFDHQYLWKKFNQPLDFLHGDNSQEKVAFKTTIFSWVWPDVSHPIRF